MTASVNKKYNVFTSIVPEPFDKRTIPSYIMVVALPINNGPMTVKDVPNTAHMNVNNNFNLKSIISDNSCFNDFLKSFGFVTARLSRLIMNHQYYLIVRRLFPDKFHICFSIHHVFPYPLSGHHSIR